jgi:hypothetical protein
VPAARTNGRATALAANPERLYEALRGVSASSLTAPHGAAPVATGPTDAAAAPADSAAAVASSVVEVPPPDRPLEPGEVRYPRTARKIARMLLQLADEGDSSFFE